MTRGLPVSKAHAYGNDFLFVPASHAATADIASLVRTLCARHSGIGADGLIVYEFVAGGATMRLWNADGSTSELSGNGLRCLAALAARHVRAGGHQPTATTVTVKTEAGAKTLELLAQEGARYTFRAAMGAPEGLRQTSIPVASETVTASILSVGNPQCVVLGDLPDAARFNVLGPALATHPMFPAGTNVEFASVESPDRVRILIWERGVGPTTSSGTGASAAAVAAAAHGGAGRSVDVISSGGTQRVEWNERGVFLTGWAEILFEGQWIGGDADHP